MGSFVRWSEVMGGILAAAEVDGFLGNRDRMAAGARDDEEAEFLAAIYELLGEESWYARDVATGAAPGTTVHAAWPAGVEVTPRSLGTWLGMRNGASFVTACGRLTLQGAPVSGVMRYRLARRDG